MTSINQSSYPSHGLTPERLAAIFREADAGDVRRQAELFEEMEEKDAHLGSVLQTRKLAVAGLDWEILSSSEEKEDNEVAGFVKEAITNIDNFDDALIDLLDAIGKGFAVSEIMWEIKGGKVLISELRWRHQRMFTFFTHPSIPSKEGTSNSPLGRGQGWVTPRLLTDAEPVYGEPLVPDKFVVHAYRARSGITPRGGVLRPCAYMYLFKNYALKDWVIFNERFAMPMRVGKFSPSATEEDRRALKNAVFNLGSDAAAVISDGAVIELLEQSGKSESGALYERLCEFCDRAMSKAVLGQTLTTDQTGGTYATARIHAEVRRDLLEADAKSLAKTLRTCIIRPLVEFNYGAGKKIPHFKFHHEEGEDLETQARTFKTLSEMGIKIPEPFIHKKFGIPLTERRQL